MIDEVGFLKTEENVFSMNQWNEDIFKMYKFL